MQFNKNNIVILSMVLLLAIVGYAFNIYESNQYISTDDDGISSTAAFGGEDYITSYDDGLTGVEENAETKTAQEEYNPFNDTDQSSVSIIEKDKDIDKVSVTNSSFFSEYILDREKRRSLEVDIWQNIINNKNTGDKYKELAQKEIVKIVSLIEKEMMMERLIVSRGFNNALVFLADESITVIVETDELTQAQVAQIQDIVVRKTKLDPNNIRIMKKD